MPPPTNESNNNNNNNNKNKNKYGELWSDWLDQELKIQMIMMKNI